jgi:hypothetical protein
MRLNLFAQLEAAHLLLRFETGDPNWRGGMQGNDDGNLRECRDEAEEGAGDQGVTMRDASTVSCEVCTTGAAKYKCPRCFAQTCSLPCVKRHKEESKCRYARLCRHDSG